MTADQVQKLLELELLPHEGGYFRRTYESKEKHGTGVCGTAIYYLVTPDQFSALHRLPQEEIFHFYGGDPVEMLQMTEAGDTKIITISCDLTAGHRPQVLAPGNVWQGTRLREGGKWALLGCTVVPGFEYSTYETPSRADLISRFPQHRKLIELYTR